MSKYKICRSCEGWNHTDSQIIEAENELDAEDQANEWALELLESWVEKVDEDEGGDRNE